MRPATCLKDATPEDLAQAINVAMSGSGNVLSPRVIQNLFDDQDSGGADAPTAAGTNTA